jgi:hypothetical protein
MMAMLFHPHSTSDTAGSATEKIFTIAAFRLVATYHVPGRMDRIPVKA